MDIPRKDASRKRLIRRIVVGVIVLGVVVGTSFALKRLKRHAPVLRDGHGVAAFFEQPRREPLIYEIVFRHQNPERLFLKGQAHASLP